MRAPEPSVLDAPNASAIAVRCITALIGVVVLVGLTAAVQPAPHQQPATTQLSALDSAELTQGRAALPQVPKSVVPSPRKSSAKPHVTKAAKPKATAKASKRVLPTGTGMWLHEWDKSNRGNARVIVQRAKSAGVSTLFVRGWSRSDGWE